MNFRDIAEQNENWIIEQRRYFHAHPELSFEEKNTTGQIGKLLEESASKKWDLRHIITRITMVSGQ